MRITRLIGASIVAGMVSTQYLLATISDKVFHVLIAPFDPDRKWSKGFKLDVDANKTDMKLEEKATRYFFSLKVVSEPSDKEFESQCAAVLRWTEALGRDYRFFWIISAQFFLEKGDLAKAKSCLGQCPYEYVMPSHERKFTSKDFAATTDMIKYFKDCGISYDAELERACEHGCIPTMISKANSLNLCPSSKVFPELRTIADTFIPGINTRFHVIFATQHKDQTQWVSKVLQAAQAKPALMDADVQVEPRRLSIKAAADLDQVSVPPAPRPVESRPPAQFPVEPAAPDQAEYVTPSFGKLELMKGAPEGGVTHGDDLLAGSAIESFSFVPDYPKRTSEQWEALAINDLDQFKHDYLEAIYILCEYKPEGYGYCPPFNEVSKSVQQYLITNYDWASALVTPNPYSEDSITRFRTDFEAAVSAEAYHKLQAKAATLKEAESDEELLLGFE
ncbi:MAG: hypothetical protein LBJ89_00050 [Holosporales bacterium]|jgi:hypothetical protein|nr:hypothetical protein [Holosporales bacterium]